MDMQGAGQLCISERETAVMLLDCEKMAKIWQRPEAERGHKKIYFHDRVQSTPGMWRRLSVVWNARDHDSEPGVSKEIGRAARWERWCNTVKNLVISEP